MKTNQCKSKVVFEYVQVTNINKKDIYQWALSNHYYDFSYFEGSNNFWCLFNNDIVQVGDYVIFDGEEFFVEPEDDFHNNYEIIKE